ncbi:adenylate/guanylate cyclase domain-containing protein [Rhizobium ruizarguesonis]|uniref:adenylate/guanylate cyclase domain-containing protein n=1 Tax=Rhizobium ruizarguesonis TaxID=2081791 RepID=UPI00103114BD|nr:adenylate/guanylate cyclase domain-containing protein [Rhizobium ruizarguesonis]NEI31880.1 tetratricopeptide repeat protein [Rhizobium ruizarguesonis]TBA24935.1 adenylate/guanylate cyclase domain-containing protein [Rhizobium ruizarguesonis]TBA46701.1 adenylate/guanylate cyclase domain-containing protein [Rhizobium ruizarguesonis]TBA62791.1 adenylate/guanylate cyclase domain-containing protein [Rhizobium ruizarguesonis]TBB65216.1 adenylate/guanylate cyclase domain-containing protein [Rhizob
MERRLSAILAADVVGYSALMEQDEAGTFDRLRARRTELFEPEIAGHHGRVFKLMGDGLLAEFGSVVDAVECAVSLQRGMAERNASVAEEERFNVRIGINIGEVIVDGDDRYGEGVNIAARLEQLALPGGICISGKVAREVDKKLAFRFDSAGRQKVKNIEEPIDVYHVRIDAPFRRRILHKRGIGRLWWALGIPAAVVAVLAAWMALYYPVTMTSHPVSSTIPSVAVLPFKDLSADKSLGYLGEGVANDVIAILSRFSDIAVVSRTSSFAYEDKQGDIRQIGTELGVGYVVEGSVRKEGDRVRIVAQLINAKTGDHVWADRFDKSGTDPWALQDELTAKIVGAMTGEFGAIRKADYSQAWGKDSTNLAEYDYYLRAESQLNLYTKEGLERSGEISRQGLQVFPGSPLLTVELGWSHWLIVALLYSSDPQKDLQEAERLVNQVLADKNLSPQVTRLANWLNAWLLTLKRDHDGAVVAMNKAIAAAPYNAFTLTDGASIFLQAGQPEKALELTDAAAARDPGLSWFVNYVRGFIFIVLGKNEDAVEVLKTTEFADAPLQLAVAYMRLGRQADARAAVEKMLKSTPAATIQSWRQTWNFRDPSILDQAAADLARAGLPSGRAQ